MAEAEAVAEASVHLIMLVKTGESQDTQWFVYKASYFGQPIRVEWDKGTTSVSLPEEVANYLLTNGYARHMTDEELEAYTAPPSPPANEDEGRKSTRRRGEKS